MTIETQLQAGWGFIPSECKCLNKKAEDFNLVRQGSISVHRRSSSEGARPKQKVAADLGGKCSRWVRKAGPLSKDG